MSNVNCLRCNFRHVDNGNCTAVGGFCTAVPASSCPLLRQYLDTELTPDGISKMKKDSSRFVIGRWIKHRAPHAIGGISAKCSACNKNIQYLGNPPCYCPHCGAKMNGGVENA